MKDQTINSKLVNLSEPDKQVILKYGDSWTISRLKCFSEKSFSSNTDIFFSIEAPPFHTERFTENSKK
jgi:hypothetical protein